MSAAPWRARAVTEYPNTTPRHAELMWRIAHDPKIIDGDDEVLRPPTAEEAAYVWDDGSYPWLEEEHDVNT